MVIRVREIVQDSTVKLCSCSTRQDGSALKGKRLAVRTTFKEEQTLTKAP